LVGTLDWRNQRGTEVQQGGAPKLLKLIPNLTFSMEKKFKDGSFSSNNVFVGKSLVVDFATIPFDSQISSKDGLERLFCYEKVIE
jgi:hypothetical protein